MIETKNVSSKGCGVPERYNGKKFIVGGITGCVIAVVSYILRMVASIGKRGRQVSWDDATMAVVLALAIPPTVFIKNCKNLVSCYKPTKLANILLQWQITALAVISGH